MSYLFQRWRNVSNSFEKMKMTLANVYSICEERLFPIFRCVAGLKCLESGPEIEQVCCRRAYRMVASGLLSIMSLANIKP